MSPYDSERVSGLKEAYRQRKGVIEGRIREFERFLEGDDEDVFAELCFCICTPQSKARTCDRAVGRLKEIGILYNGTEEDIASGLRGVRFRRNKARFIVTARDEFSSGGRIRIKGKLSDRPDARELREWLVKNVKGLGYKEASHFLRNIGLGLDMAILDRHILKNLKLAGVIDTVPVTLTRRRYLEIERMAQAFSKEIGIPMRHLDLLLWSQETGEVFR